jgi:hypothetical protein
MNRVIINGVDWGGMESSISDDRDWDFMEWEESLAGGRLIIWDTVSKRVSYFRFFIDSNGRWRGCPDELGGSFQHESLLQLFDNILWGHNG